jgi:hypothetical protein
MNEKEIAEIKRRFNPQRSNITRIRGCCVSTEKAILSEFDQTLSFLTEDESEKILAILKKTLSGNLQRTLVDIEFSTKQVLEAPEHKALMDIRSSGLADDEAVKSLFERIIETVEMDTNYVIILANDKYDVPSHGVDGEKSGESNEVFNYFVCAICPIKTSKSQLGFYISGNPFRSVAADTVVCAPELGFMFPTFDDRTANIYKTMLYTKNTEADNSVFVEKLFGASAPIPAELQKETFGNILEQTADEECNLHLVKTLHNHIAEMIEEHKENKVEEPLMLDKRQISEVLGASGITEEQISAFEEKFESEFGEQKEISPRNLLDTKSFKVKTADVVIKVNPKRTDLIKTRVIDGEKYILISAEEDVEVNGVSISIM